MQLQWIYSAFYKGIYIQVTMHSVTWCFCNMVAAKCGYKHIMDPTTLYKVPTEFFSHFCDILSSQSYSI